MSIDLVEFSTLALAHFVALLSPGPDFILIMGSSFKYGCRQTFPACLGIALANGVYILLAIGGFSLLRENLLLFWGMKLTAAGYLFYMGALLIKSTAGTVDYNGSGAGIVKIGFTRMLGRGVMSAILNPKNAIFYLSLMALIVSQQTPVSNQLLYGLWMVGAVLCWDVLVSWSIGNPAVRKGLAAYSWQIERGSGLVLMLVGGFIILK